MARSIKLSDNEVAAIEAETKVTSRSLAGQAEHWLRIGRAIENSPNFSYDQIKAALSGLTSPDELSLEEQDVFFEEFCDSMWEEPGAEVKAFYANLKGPGLDDNDNLVYPSTGK